MSHFNYLFLVKRCEYKIEPLQSYLLNLELLVYYEQKLN
jgi:hypothetical protein